MKTINDIKLSELKKYCELNYSRALHEIRKQYNNSHMLYCVDNNTTLTGCFTFEESEFGYKHWINLLDEIVKHQNEKRKTTATKLMIKYNSMKDHQKLEFMQQIADLFNHIENNK